MAGASSWSYACFRGDLPLLPTPLLGDDARMGTHPALTTELSALDPALRARLDRAGFDQDVFLALAASVTEGDPITRRRTRNTVKGEVRPPSPGEIGQLPSGGTAEHDALARRGEEALARGEVAFCTLAGGMATRMGGIVKALAEVYDEKTFLDLRLAENASAKKRFGATIPLWLMTSEATHEALASALKERGAPSHIALFMQNLSLRLAMDGSLFIGEDGHPSVYATGHGDVVDALRRSGQLDGFLARGGKYVWITNLDNLGASIDPVLLGRFIASGADVQGEVCRKEGDAGGIPVHAEGKLQVLEEFRLPAGFDPTTVNVFNTNTFLLRAEPLAKAKLSWTYFEVEKKVATKDGPKPAIQFERLIQEVTAHLPATYVEVPRDGAGSRFLPVKDFDELARRRPTIQAVARARGME
jgi:UTP--glucose-1-phosphate uridylyltransferase